MRIIVSGLVGLHPVGGVAWDYLQYPVGLMRLGHEVFYHEDTWSWPYHPIMNRNTDRGDYSAKYIRKYFEQYAPDLAERWHYLHLHKHSYGMSRKRFEEVARTADLFINISGSCLIPDSLSAHCKKLFIDTDPGYNQMVLVEKPRWSENVSEWCDSVRGHDLHFTYAENIGGQDCIIPHAGITWRTTRMPVVLDLWRDTANQKAAPDLPWTTVMTWNAFGGPLVYRGVEYMSKGAEFEKFISLPLKVSMPLNVAVGGKDPPIARLERVGWHVVDGPLATRSPGDYKRFLQSSRGEFSTAKHVYVATKSGWFSCRSACYLASARPVVVQDTGFSTILPRQYGLIPFSDMPEAMEALESVEKDYERHANGALNIANDHFASGKVLNTLLADAGC